MERYLEKEIKLDQTKSYQADLNSSRPELSNSGLRIVVAHLFSGIIFCVLVLYLGSNPAVVCTYKLAKNSDLDSFYLYVAVNNWVRGRNTHAQNI